jgi:F5/8 type C domain-containing protein
LTTLITKYDRLALLLIVLLAAVLFLVWARFPEYKSFGQGDPYLDANQYLPGKNFAERGFFREHFLAEYATGPEECYPLWYTHNPSLSEIMSGLYYRAGLHKISQQRVIAILWNLLAAWFFYLLLKRLAGPLIALISLAVFISNPLYIAWGDNLFTNHQWCFVFAGMYFFLRAIDTAKRANLYTGLAALCFFLLCYSNYEYVAFVAIFFVGVKVLKIRKVPWSRILIPLGAGLMAVFIHQVCVIRAIGFDYWLLDKTESFLHRTGMGITPLMEIYRRVPILMWEEQTRLHGSYTLSIYWKGFYLHLENLFGNGWSIIFLAICIFGRRFLPGTVSDRKKLSRTIILFFIMSVFWFLAFVQHTADHQWGSTILLFAPFAAFLYGATLAGILLNFIRGNNRVSITIGILVIAAGLSGLIWGRVKSFRPFQPYPGISTLKKYRGKPLLTNAIPTLVSTYTGMPTGWLGNKHPALIFSHSRYLVNPACTDLPEPNFFFSPRHPEYPEFSRTVDSWLTPRFQVEERGSDYTIYNLKKPLDPSVRRLADREMLVAIRQKLTRGVAARLGETPPSSEYAGRAIGKNSNRSIAEQVAWKVLALIGSPSFPRTNAGDIPMTITPVTGNLLSLPSRLEASSHIEGERPVDNLRYPDPMRYWHVALERIGEPAWVTVDLGINRAQPVNFIRTRPRADIRRQYFRTAVIQGSQDGEDWEDIAAVIEDEVPSSAGWRGWVFRNDIPYRLYRLFIIDGHEENGAFYSLGALELYRCE